MGNPARRIKIGSRAVGLLLGCILGLMPGMAGAQVSIRASVSPNPATIEDEINLSISIEGSIQASEPVLPSMPAFKAVASGTSSSIQIINGSMSTRKEYNFTLIPLEEGKFTIAPISVFAKGQEYKTDPIEITVGASGQVPRAPAPGIPGPGTPPGPPTQPQPFDEPEPPLDASERGQYWIETRVSNKEPFVNEQILFTFRFYTRIQVGAAQLTLPEFKDFWTEEVVPEKKYYQDINGQRYVVSEKVIALYPLQSGAATVGETLLRAEVPSGIAPSHNPFDDFFGGFNRMRMKPKNLKAPAIALTVKPLPDGAPANFTNLVGDFTVSASLSDAEIKVGESTTLNVEIAGRGNIKDAVLPDFFRDPAFKIYDDKPGLDITRKESGIEGKKSFKKALVPTRPGEFTVPPVELSFFNPESGQYETMSAPGLTLKAAPSEGESLGTVSPQTGSQPRPAIQEDLAPLHAQMRPVRSWIQGNEILVLLAGLLPMAAYLILWAIGRRRDRLKTRAPAYRRRSALKTAERALKDAQRTEAAQALPKALDAIRDYVGDLNGVYGKSLTRPEMIRLLEARGLKPELAGSLDQLIRQLEAACYGGGSQRPVPEWVRQASDLLKKIDRSVA